ncbi:MAG: cytochrome c3 family protein [Candidatus Coatesbacteria bacterium]|nr:cytochrome c3 family protein [Candidatus Coatesbacteria bacterium]
MRARVKWRPRLLAGLLLLSLLVFIGCAVFIRLGNDNEPQYSHSKHVKSLGLKCENCHSSTETSKYAGMPVQAICEVCHKSDPQYSVFMSFRLKGDSVVWYKAHIYTEDMVFSHALHSDAGVTCAECHGDVAGSDSVSPRFMPSKDDCIRCHARHRNLGSDCSICHTRIGKTFEPLTHRRSWLQLHGQIVRSGRDIPYENRCDMCHAGSFCSACHEVNPPHDHTNHFRLRWHGVSAGMDRQRCETCHRTDFCNRCHEQATPNSHNAGWGPPGYGHCLTCHFPVSGEACGTCHRTEDHRGHAAALPQDADHTSLNPDVCRLCHGPWMHHPDTGEDCLRCHG